MAHSSAHAALFCHDILAEIFACLSPGWFPWLRSDRDSHESEMIEDQKARKALRGTLASCARTCHAFSDVALAELWKIIDHYVFLFVLLPKWKRGPSGAFHSTGMIDVEPDIDDQTWSRFRRYARLVCEMNTAVFPHDNVGVHLNTWILLASRLKGEPLLPSLRRLKMPVDVSKDAIPLLFSLSPTVQILTFEYDHPWFMRALGHGSCVAEDTEFLYSFLRLISESSGDSLDASMGRFLEGEAEEVKEHIRMCARLSALQQLDLSLNKTRYPIDHSTVRALSRLSSLRTLTIGLPAQDVPTTPLFADFNSLRNLSLAHLPITVLSEVLSTSPSLRNCHSLRSINLETSTGLRAQDNTFSVIPLPEFQHHLSLIRAALPDDLESIRLRLTYHRNTGGPPPFSNLFAPFLSLVRLKTFAVSFRDKCHLRVADEDLRVLSAAWPDIEVLSIQTWQWRPPSTLSTRHPPTVAGLVELAMACPRLRRIVVPGLDVSELAENDVEIAHGNFNHKAVRFLDVGALVGDGGVTARDVASVLDRIFPFHSEYLIAGREHHRATSWFAVHDAMRGIRAARTGVSTSEAA